MMVIIQYVNIWMMIGINIESDPSKAAQEQGGQAMRVSKAQAQANRAHVVETASQLFRERGYDGVGVADLMAAAGFTHVLPWPAPRAFDEAARRGVEQGTRRFAASQNMTPTQTDEVVARALSQIPDAKAQAALDAVYLAYAEEGADFDALAKEQERLEAILAAGDAHTLENQLDVAADALRLPAWAEGEAASQERSYTISDAANGRSYRISVKRAGVASSWLHAHLAPGAQIELMGPAGDFVFEEGTGRPVVMLSAGIGITPMIAMLNSVLVNGSRTRHRHPIYFIHGAREVAHPFAVHLQTLAAGHSNLAVHVQRKRIDINLLRELPKDDYDYYLCGPSGFMQSMYAALRELHVPEQRIRLESFGPSSLPQVNTAASGA